MKPRRCAEKSCKRPAYKAPLLILYPLNDHSGSHYECRMDLPLCKIHAKMSFDDVVTIEAWESICNGFLQAGKEVPDRNRAKMRMVAL